MTKQRVALAGWALAGVGTCAALLIISMFALVPVLVYPAVVLSTAPFVGLAVWLAWLVRQRVRHKLTPKSAALLAGAVVPLAYMAVETAVYRPQAIAFIGPLIS